MITDRLGNPINDGDWLDFNIKEMATGQVLMVAEGSLLDASQKQTPAFINVLIQIPCDAGTKRLSGVSKCFGPPRPAEG